MKLPPPPQRQKFSSQAEYEEAQGAWRARVGRIKGMRGAKKTAA